MRLRACLPLLLLALAPMPASADVITLDGYLGGRSTVVRYAGSFINDDLGGVVFSLPSDELRGPAFEPGTDRPAGGLTRLDGIDGRPGSSGSRPDVLGSPGSAPPSGVTVPEP